MSRVLSSCEELCLSRVRSVETRLESNRKVSLGDIKRNSSLKGFGRNERTDMSVVLGEQPGQEKVSSTGAVGLQGGQNKIRRGTKEEILENFSGVGGTRSDLSKKKVVLAVDTAEMSLREGGRQQEHRGVAISAAQDSE